MHALPKYFLVMSKDTAVLYSPYLTTWGDMINPLFYWDGMTAHFMVGLPKFGDKVDIASIEHDYQYIYEGDLPSGKTVTRLEADKLLRKNLLIAGNPLWKCELAFFYVRSFGWVKWKRKNKRAI